MYLADPVEALTAVAASVRPGGIVAFQEWHAVDAFLSTPLIELWNRTGALLVATFGDAGTNLTMGLGLRACFVAAGLAEPELHAGRLIGGGSSFGGYRFLSEIIRSVVPEIERSGLATPDNSTSTRSKSAYATRPARRTPR